MCFFILLYALNMQNKSRLKPLQHIPLIMTLTLTFDGGGELILSSFFNNYFQPKLDISRGVNGYGLGDTKPVDTPVSQEIWLYSTMQKIPKNFLFYCFWDRGYSSAELLSGLQGYLKICRTFLLWIRLCYMDEYLI